jgi:hypothetical protein
MAQISRKLEKFAPRFHFAFLPHDSEGILNIVIPFHLSRRLKRRDGSS